MHKIQAMQGYGLEMTRSATLLLERGTEVTIIELEIKELRDQGTRMIL